MEPWIHCDYISGEKSKKINISLDENTGPEREASIEVTIGEKSCDVSIYQEACSCNHQLLKDILTYRIKWTDFGIYHDTVVDISNDGTVLKILKFKPNYIILLDHTNEPANSVDFCTKWTNWRIKIEGIQQLYSDGVITSYTHNTYGGPQYTAWGLSFIPFGNDDPIYNYPWDMGVPGGSLKDPNGGYATYGYRNDGVKNVFNISSFSVQSTMGTSFRMGIRLYSGRTDNLDEDGFLDISDNPITLTLLPTNDLLPLWKQECWEYIDSKGQTHPKTKTVENCLKKYYGGTDYTNPDYILDYRDENNINHNNVAINRVEINPDGLCTELFGGYDRDTEPYYEYPPLEEISDLNNYNTLNLSIKATYGPSADAWADWLNEHMIKWKWVKSVDETTNIMHNYPIYSWALVNSESHPVVINVDYNDYPSITTLGFLILNYVMNDGVGITGQRIYSSINYLKINYVGTSGRVSVMQNTFTNAYIGHLEVTHNNEFINPDTYGIRPTQFINTFAWQSGFDTLPEYGIGITCFNSEYMFDWNSNIKAINTPGYIEPCYGSYGYAAGSQGEYRWPCPVEEEGIVNTEVPCTAYQTFANATNLETIVPVINVRWCWDGSNTEGLYHFFANNNKLTSVRISHINCGDWDFADIDGNFYLPNIDADSIKYIFDNAEDLVGIPFNADNVIEGNVPKYVTDGTTYDYVNIRSSKSADGLNIYCPETWRDKITSEMISSINAKGWTIYIGGEIS